MRLISCRIENFGKLSDFELEFGPNNNIICQDNGWGKSTLAAFIRAMFYGLEGDRKRSVKENERLKYKPWQGGVFGGSLIFEVSERQYIANRIFGDKESKDEFELRDARTNLVSSDFSSRLGEELFGIDRESFMRTTFLGQGDIAFTATDDINAKLGNIVDAANDMSNYESAVDCLTKDINFLAPTRVTGSINKRNKEIADCETVIKNGEGIEESLKFYEASLNSEKEQFVELREKVRKLDKKQERLVEQALNASRKSQPQPLEENVKKSGTGVTISVIGIIVTIICIVASYLLKDMRLMGAAIVGLVIVVIGVVVFVKASGKNGSSTGAERDNTTEQENYSKQNTELKIAIEETNDRLDKSREHIRKYSQRVEELREQLDEWNAAKDKLVQLKELQEEEMARYYHVTMAREYLGKARDAIGARYNGPVKEAFAEYMSSFEGEVSDKYYINANSEISVMEAGKQRNVETLSSGYQDMIAFGLRTAMIDAMFKNEKPFIIMDDPLVNLDDKKSETVKRLIAELANRYQILYFTCSESRV